MTVGTTIRAAAAAGVRIRVDGDRLILSAARRPDEHLVRELRSEKAKVLEYLRALALWSEEDWQALFDERAGIMEFDGGLSRTEAGTRAKEEVNILRSLVRSGDG